MYPYLYAISMDKACVYFSGQCQKHKSRFLFSWGMEVVEQHKLDHILFCFLVAGHTKFAPDPLFALIANAYNRTDVRKNYWGYVSSSVELPLKMG